MPREAKELLSLAANPPTLAMRLDAATKDVAAKHVAHREAEAGVPRPRRFLPRKSRRPKRLGQRSNRWQLRSRHWSKLKPLPKWPASPPIRWLDFEVHRCSVSPAKAAAEKYEKEKAEAMATLAAAAKSAEQAKAAIERSQAILAASRNRGEGVCSTGPETR